MLRLLPFFLSRMLNNQLPSNAATIVAAAVVHVTVAAAAVVHITAAAAVHISAAAAAPAGSWSKMDFHSPNLSRGSKENFFLAVLAEGFWVGWVHMMPIRCVGNKQRK